MVANHSLKDLHCAETYFEEPSNATATEIADMVVCNPTICHRQSSLYSGATPHKKYIFVQYKNLLMHNNAYRKYNYIYIYMQFKFLQVLPVCIALGFDEAQLDFLFDWRKAISFHIFAYCSN